MLEEILLQMWDRKKDYPFFQKKAFYLIQLPVSTAPLFPPKPVYPGLNHVNIIR